MVTQTRVPSRIDIAMEASKRGNYQMARKILQSSIEQLAEQENKQSRLVELMITVGDTYTNEGSLERAKAWYGKALQRCVLLEGAHTFQVACLMAKLAQLSVLQSNMPEFHECFEKVQRGYLLSDESNICTIIGPLTDLSSALCIRGFLVEVQSVNKLISQIKQLEEEDRSGLGSEDELVKAI